MNKLMEWCMKHQKGIKFTLQSMANILAAIATALATTSCMNRL